MSTPDSDNQLYLNYLQKLEHRYIYEIEGIEKFISVYLDHLVLDYIEQQGIPRAHTLRTFTREEFDLVGYSVVAIITSNSEEFNKFTKWVKHRMALTFVDHVKKHRSTQ